MNELDTRRTDRDYQDNMGKRGMRVNRRASPMARDTADGDREAG